MRHASRRSQAESLPVESHEEAPSIEPYCTKRSRDNFPSITEALVGASNMGKLRSL